MSLCPTFTCLQYPEGSRTNNRLKAGGDLEGSIATNTPQYWGKNAQAREISVVCLSD